MKLERSFSESISAATTLYSSSTEEQRPAARFTTTLAIGPMKAASSRLTESRIDGSSELFEDFGVAGPGLLTGDPDGGLTPSEGEDDALGWMASVCSVAASSMEMWVSATRKSAAL